MTTVDPAVRQARRVVGLYGDPTVTWSIALGVELRTSVVPDAVATRAAQGWESWAHLGMLPKVELVPPDEWSSCRAGFLDTPYGDADPLVRIGLTTDGRRLLVAAHHGVIDGLGMLGLVGRLAGVPITSSARGIQEGAEPAGFWSRAIGRLGEALLRPPARLGPTRRRSPAGGDWVHVSVLPASALGTGQLVAAVTRAGLAWRGRSRRRTVLSLALSTRPGAPQPAPDRATAYGRIVTCSGSDAESAAALRELVPEPAFPETTVGGVGPAVTKLLGSRLGATALVSNLGRLSGDGVVGAELWPAPSGPAGIAVAAVTAGELTTVTLRMRRGWFTEAETAEFGDHLARQLAQYGS